MNVFVTTGTTEFDILIETVDSLLAGDTKYSHCNFIAQISTSASYFPKNMFFFDFSIDIENYIETADVIITHAGAGSVYSMLEKQKKLIVVPNLSRIDHHQSELSNYVDKKNLAFSCEQMKNLPRLFDAIQYAKFSEYKKDPFSATEYILDSLK